MKAPTMTTRPMTAMSARNKGLDGGGLMYNGMRFLFFLCLMTCGLPHADSMTQKLCAIRDVPENNAIECVIPAKPAVQRILLLRIENGFRAYLDVCPHQGRSLALAPGEFIFNKAGELMCPHHGACFDIETGTCISGPCRGAQLSAIPIELRDEDIWWAGD